MTDDRATRPMRLALLGCGYAAHLHSKTLRGRKRDVVRYYASRNIANAVEYNLKYRGAGTFGSYDEAIASDDIDVVAVLSPPAQHLDLTLRALGAGKDVIVEKPPFMHSSDFDAVERACAATGHRVFVAENYYYKPLAVALRKIFAERLIGDVLFIHLNAIKQQVTDGWRDDPALTGTGALFEGGIHWVNFLANLGMDVQQVHGFRPGSGEGVERSMLCTFQYDSGAVATLSYSWEVPTTFKGLRISRIYGSKGSIMFETNGIFCAVNGTRKQFFFPGLRDIAGYKAMFRDFVRAWRTGDEPAMNLAKARRDLELIETAYRTAGVQPAALPAKEEVAL